MVLFLGCVLLAIALSAFYAGLRRPRPGEPERTGPDRGRVATGIVLATLGGFLTAWPSLAIANLEPVDLSSTDTWVIHPPVAAESPIRWEGKALQADLEAGSGRYAVFPVDWSADRFEAEWDIAFSHLDRSGDEILMQTEGRTRPHRRSKLDFASFAVGLMDQNVANVDDRDHVSGSSIQACFSDDIRLRASDANLMVRTASATESGSQEIDPDFKPQQPIHIELDERYHCRMVFDIRRHEATLDVTTATGRPIASRRLDELADFTNSVSWFGVSVRGYNRYDKKLDPTRRATGYTRPRASARIENLKYSQP